MPAGNRLDAQNPALPKDANMEEMSLPMIRIPLFVR